MSHRLFLFHVNRSISKIPTYSLVGICSYPQASRDGQTQVSIWYFLHVSFSSTDILKKYEARQKSRHLSHFRHSMFQYSWKIPEKKKSHKRQRANRQRQKHRQHSVRKKESTEESAKRLHQIISNSGTSPTRVSDSKQNERTDTKDAANGKELYKSQNAKLGLYSEWKKEQQDVLRLTLGA